jgi:hypothetical protein
MIVVCGGAVVDLFVTEARRRQLAAVKAAPARAPDART